jgi:enamine deaminase RidA (YjgF/YER057c/UK114 family)
MTRTAPCGSTVVERNTLASISGERMASAMDDSPESILKNLGIELPSVPTPQANYVPTVRTGNLLYVSGQVSISGGQRFVGKVGKDLTIEQGQQAARVCAINILANIKTALGGFDKLARIVKLTGFVNCPVEFEEPHKVVNGCSDLLTEVLGSRGKHSRSAIGVATLPLGAAVEVEAIIEVA